MMKNPKREIYSRKKYFLIVCVILLSSSNIRSQNFSPIAISSSGGFYSNGSAMLSLTVAEMTMVQTFTSSNSILTQGFQQPEVYALSLNDHNINLKEIILFPNPTNGVFNLNINANEELKASIKIYNIIGQPIYSNSTNIIQGKNTCKFDISDQSQGVYILELISVNKKGLKEISILKVNLIY